MRTEVFREGVDYRWLPVPKRPWWAYVLPGWRDFVHRAKLLRDYQFEIPGKGTFVIQAGYNWNGTSAGMPFRRKDDRRVMRATLVHDWLYDESKRPRGVTREDADEIFFQLLRQDRAPRRFIRLALVAADEGLFGFAWRHGIT